MRHGFLQDAKGNNSVMRLAFLLLIVAALLMSCYALMFEGSADAIAIFASISGVAVTLKTIQNQQEKGTVNNGGGERT